MQFEVKAEMADLVSKELQGLNQEASRQLLERCGFSTYKKNAVAWLRPYIVGESLEGISVNKEDTPEEGGFIAVNKKNPKDQWYVGKQFFADNYERAYVGKDEVTEPLLGLATTQQLIDELEARIHFLKYRTVDDE